MMALLSRYDSPYKLTLVVYIGTYFIDQYFIIKIVYIADKNKSH